MTDERAVTGESRERVIGVQVKSGAKNYAKSSIHMPGYVENMLDEKELCNTQPISYSEENVNVDTLRNVEVNEVTPVENCWRETMQGFEVLQIESNISISIARNDDDEVAIEIGVILERPEETQIESKETNLWYSFVLEVPNELPILKEGVHAALPKYVDASFVVDISKGEGIT
ncbi:hypothetical protein Syun_024204 [Stephania yunnanensis]|uniref:Uncharacterized protein n=1 Tax=Stephania yunnanensis TaxID=152371 RepID=A0AAP0I0C2_9MAGN